MQSVVDFLVKGVREPRMEFFRRSGSKSASPQLLEESAPAPLVSVGSRVPASPMVSIVILVLDNVEGAQRCIHSLRTSKNYQLGVEVIIVANGTSSSALAALDHDDEIVLVRSQTNLGFGGGGNLAASVARGSYLLFLNDDAITEEGLVENLLATAESDPLIGAVGSRVLWGDGTLQEAGAIIWSDGSASHVGRGLPSGSTAYLYVRDVDYASANGLLVRRCAWDAVGGFDEGYHPAYFEDTDLCMAMRKHGYRVVYEPRARLRHLESQSTSSKFKDFLMARNRQRFAVKWATELAPHDDRPRHESTAVERGILRARGLPPRLLLAGGPAAGFGSIAASSEIWKTAEVLAARGWAVTISAPGADPDAMFSESRRGLGHRLFFVLGGG